MDDQEAEELHLLKLQRRKRMYLYGSFLMCVLAISLVAAALGTQSWFEADLENDEYAADSNGHFNSGLFKGSSLENTELKGNTFTYYTVCLDGYCLFSCGATKKDREQHIHSFLYGGEVTACIADGATTASEARLESTLRVTSARSNLEAETPLGQAQFSLNGFLAREACGILGEGEQEGTGFWASLRRGCDKVLYRGSTKVGRETFASASKTGNSTVPGGSTDGLLSESLWACTIAFLVLGMLFGGVGSVFAIVNTATTPVEAITGIPGLYIWNGVAGAMELIAIIVWSVQFSTHLKKNVLVVDSLQGWTTEGNEKLGYSFWLVIVAIVVHIANCALIFFGTYEPKAKERIHEPDKATNDILLY